MSIRSQDVARISPMDKIDQKIAAHVRNSIASDPYYGHGANEKTREQAVGWFLATSRRIATLLRDRENPSSLPSLPGGEKEIHAEGRLLDVGISRGFVFGLLSRNFDRTVGVDLDITALKSANKFLDLLSLPRPLVKADVNRLPFKDGSFHKLVASCLLEHIPFDQWNAVLLEFSRVLVRDGIAYVSTANRLWPVEPHFHTWFLSFLPRRWAAAYVQKRFRVRYDLYLPFRGRLLKELSSHFRWQDYTLECLRRSDYYGIEPSRKRLAGWVKKVLDVLESLKRFVILKYVACFFEELILHTAAGWFLICIPLAPTRRAT